MTAEPGGSTPLTPMTSTGNYPEQLTFFSGPHITFLEDKI
jgi:hypothetical protein